MIAVLTTTAAILTEAAIGAQVTWYESLLDFDNIMRIINLVFLAAIAFFTVYYRVEALVNKVLARRREEETVSLHAEIAEYKEEFSVIVQGLTTFGDTLLMIVQASKMLPEDKLQIAQNWAKTKVKIDEFMERKNERIEQFKEAFKEHKENLMAVFEPAKDIISRYVSKDDEEDTK